MDKELALKFYTEGNYVDYEIYEYNDIRQSLKADFTSPLEWTIDDIPDNVSLDFYYLNKEEYENAFYEGWGEDYDPNGKIMIIVLPWNWREQLDMKELYYGFLEEQGTEEKVKKIIADGIGKWKKFRAYKVELNFDPETRVESVSVIQIAGKDIGDICTTDEEVAKAYTGEVSLVGTYHGLRPKTVAASIGEDIKDCLNKQRLAFIRKHTEKWFLEFFGFSSYEYDAMALITNDENRNKVARQLEERAPHHEWFERIYQDWVDLDVDPDLFKIYE